MTVCPPRLSIVIPTYNGRSLLETCLGSLYAHRPAGIAIEIIVADDASTDGTADWLAVRYPEVVVVRREVNGGFCASANAGLAAARGEFIQLLNNDTEVTSGWVEAGLGPFDDPAVGSVAPLVVVRSSPERVDSAGDSYSLLGWPTKRGHGEASESWSRHRPDEVFGASGSSAFYRAEALRRAGGGFDPAFGSYYEDVDLAFRMRWAGYRCVFAPECRILHEVSASYDHRRPALQRRMARNAELLFWSNMPGRWLWLAALPHAWFITVQAIYRLLRGRPAPFMLGKLDALREWNTLRARRTLRAEMARSAARRPHFPWGNSGLRAVRNHLKRPSEASSR